MKNSKILKWFLAILIVGGTVEPVLADMGAWKMRKRCFDVNISPRYRARVTRYQPNQWGNWQQFGETVNKGCSSANAQLWYASNYYGHAWINGSSGGGQTASQIPAGWAISFGWPFSAKPLASNASTAAIDAKTNLRWGSSGFTGTNERTAYVRTITDSSRFNADQQYWFEMTVFVSQADTNQTGLDTVPTVSNTLWSGKAVLNKNGTTLTGGFIPLSSNFRLTNSNGVVTVQVSSFDVSFTMGSQYDGANICILIKSHIEPLNNQAPSPASLISNDLGDIEEISDNGESTFIAAVVPIAYPNPATSSLEISGLTSSATVSVSAVNPVSGNSTPLPFGPSPNGDLLIDVSALAPGTYSLQVLDYNGNLVTQLIVKQ
jgi:hypothetical protein